MKKIAITQNMNLADCMLSKLEEAGIKAELKSDRLKILFI